MQDQERYRQLAEAAVKSLRDGTHEQVMPVKVLLDPVSAAAAARSPDNTFSLIAGTRPASPTARSGFAAYRIRF